MSYFKYNNNYWDTNKIGKLKKRIFTYFLSSIILFEGYSIATRQPPSKLINYLYSKLTYGFDELSKDFPLRAIAYANFFTSNNESIDQQELDNYLENSFTKYDIKDLIKKDKGVTYAEIGGAVMLVEKGELKYLNFVEIESENMELSKKIIKNKDNKKRLKKLFLLEKEKFERLLNIDILEDTVSYKKSANTVYLNDKQIYEISSSYVATSNDTYIIDLERLIDSFYPLSGTGKCIGIFHIHDDGSPPSENDIKMSQNLRSFVISNLENKYIIYELAEGEIKYLIERDF